MLVQSAATATIHPTLTLGTYRQGSRRIPIVLGPAEVRSHGVVSGKSGFGKSTFLQSVALQYLAEREPFSLIDPHSDTARGILHYLLTRGFFSSPDAFARLWYVKWSRQDSFIPFNVLDQPRFDTYTLAGHIHEAFVRAFPSADGTTPLFSSILLPSLVVLIENKQPITALLTLLTDKAWRDSLLRRVDDPNIHAFFQRFEGWAKGAAIESTARRLHLLVFNPVLRYSLGQTRNVLDFRTILDLGISVLHDLGGLDDETRRLLMCLLQVGYENAALAREGMPASQRRPHHLIVDEAATSAATSAEGLTHMLEQTRKFNLFVLLSFQSIQQLPRPLQLAVGNVALEVAFRQNEADAHSFAHRFTDLTGVGPSERTHGSASWLQQQQMTGMALEQLGVQEARVRVGDQLAAITTVSVPRANDSDPQLARLADAYALHLGTPADQARRDAHGGRGTSQGSGMKGGFDGHGIFAEAV